MTVVVLVCAGLLAVAGVLAVVRMERGPSMLDRTIALDVLTTTLVAAVALEAAWSRRTDTVPLLVALSLVGFVGSVTIARFASREPPGEGRVRTREEIMRDEAARIVDDAARTGGRRPEEGGP
jgi:multicomponent Na+:H+ antiporter subunit F